MITTILMPYKRPDNIKPIFDGIRKQTIKSKIWVWDTKGEYAEGSGEDSYFYSSADHGHRPRFTLAGLVTTPYVFIQDDDFAINDPTLFEQLIELEKKYPGYLIGVKGKKFDDTADKEKPYQHNTCWMGEGKVDMVNTGLCFFKTELLNKIPHPFYNDIRTVTEKEYNYGDDMYISSFNKCYATELFVRCIDKLPENNRGLSHDPIHMEIRNELCRRYWL